MKKDFWISVFHPQWIVRALVSLVLTAVAVWTISFKTADYVVAANVSSMDSTLNGLQSSIDRLNETVRDNIMATQRLHDTLSLLRADTASQSQEISFLRSDVTKIASAVQDAGIQIRIRATESGDGFSDLKFDSIELPNSFQLPETYSFPKCTDSLKGPICTVDGD